MTNLDQRGIDLAALREHGFSHLPADQQRRLVGSGELDEAAGVPKVYKVNDLVSLDPELSSGKYVGVNFKVIKVNTRTLKLQPTNGGRVVNADKTLIVPPVVMDATAQCVQYPTEHLVCGSLVKIGNLRQPKGWLQDGAIGVVLVDKGDRINVAPLGGLEDRYARLPRRMVTALSLSHAELAVLRDQLS